jgi:hypothetical protein
MMGLSPMSDESGFVHVSTYTIVHHRANTIQTTKRTRHVSYVRTIDSNIYIETASRERNIVCEWVSSRIP